MLLYDLACWALFHALDILGVLAYAWQSFVDGTWHAKLFEGKRWPL